MGLIIDSFAGGGGASTGIELALGRSPNIAINHSAEALAMHARNHPKTVHLVEDVWNIDMRKLVRGRPIDLLWASPDCTHHSKAKGGKPRDNDRRGLADVVVDWARDIRPNVIALENVTDFAGWGPLDEDGQPIKARRGEDFDRWSSRLRAAGYQLEHRNLSACDYGAPTSRKRLFLVARRDGHAIHWPTPTHGPGLPHAWRSAAECLDWSVPVPDVFGRERPLVPATLRRIAHGLERFVFGTDTPFYVPGGIAFLIQTSYGERKAKGTHKAQAPRVLDISDPLGVVVAGGIKHAVVVAFIARHYGGNGTPGASPMEPLHTITCKDHHALVTATIGSRAEQPANVREFLAAYCPPPAADLFGARPRPIITALGMRLLTPRELFRAQGFPDSYDITAPSVSAAVRLVGNSVSPPVAAALVRANLGKQARRAA